MDLIIEYQAQLLSGTWVTIKLAILSLVIAVLCGLLGAWAKLSKNFVAQKTAAGYTTVVRGVPDLVLILLLSLLLWFVLINYKPCLEICYRINQV